MKTDLWVTLRGDYCTSITVPDDATPLDALVQMLEDQYGGEAVEFRDNVVVRSFARNHLHADVWFSCLQWQREEYSDDPDSDYWSPDGQGARSVQVFWTDRNIYDLGEQAIPA